MTQISTEPNLRPEYYHTLFESSSPAEECPGQFAVITAYNPNGRLVAAEENERPDRTLREFCRAAECAITVSEPLPALISGLFLRDVKQRCAIIDF
jgi:hypothetical protein